MEKRLVAFIILSMLILWTAFTLQQLQNPPQSPEPTQPQRTPTAAPDAEERITPSPDEIRPTTPTAQTESTFETEEPALGPMTHADAPTVQFSTELYDVEFSLRGGVPVRWDIIDPRYVTPIENNGNDAPASLPVEHLIDPNLAQYPQIPRPFEVRMRELNAGFFKELNYALYESKRIQRDGLTGWRFTSPPTAEGLYLVKEYLFPSDGFEGRFEITIVNESGQNIVLSNVNQQGLGLVLGPGLGHEPPSDSPLMRFSSVDAVLKGDESFQYAQVKELDEVELEEESKLMPAIEWGGIQSTYFATILVPDDPYPFSSARAYIDRSILGTLTTTKQLRFYPTMELYGAQIALNAGERQTYGYDLYVGPKQLHRLREAGHELTRLLFHNSWQWFRALCLGLMSLLFWFHNLVGNWGVAIIMLTILVKVLTFPMVHKGMKAQAKFAAQQQRLKPLIEKLNQKYKDDPQRKQQEMFKLYREHNINPFGMLKGCGWLLVQMPIFIGLYRLLYQSIDLRGADFLWVRDLSQPDKLFALPFALPFIGTYFNLLPLITALTQMLTSKFTMTPATDPQQEQMQKMMIYFMPLFILVITYQFPAGLMLYWLVSNFWQVVQQVYVNEKIRKPMQMQEPTASAPAR